MPRANRLHLGRMVIEDGVLFLADSGSTYIRNGRMCPSAVVAVTDSTLQGHGEALVTCRHQSKCYGHYDLVAVGKNGD